MRAGFPVAGKPCFELGNRPAYKGGATFVEPEVPAVAVGTNLYARYLADGGNAFTDTGKTGGAKPGDAIAALTDHADNAVDLLQATSSRRPSRSQPHSSGRTGLVYDGTALMHLKGTFAASRSQPNTLFIVAQLADLDVNRNIVEGSALGTVRHWIRQKTDGTLNMGASADVGAANPASIDTPFLITALFDGTSSVLRVDGAQIATGNCGSWVMGGISLGDFIGGWPMNGTIWEVLVYDADMTSSIATIETDLLSQWSIS